MARQPVPQIGRPTPIQPVAAPVSTYVRPADPAPSSLHQLAQGLAAFDSGLKTWIEKKEAEQAKADAIRGEAAFNRNNQVGWAEGVRSGQIPANASPVFRAAYKKDEGELLGIRMREQFQTAYAKWEGRNSDDPEVFRAFLSDFVSKHVTTDDPEVLAGFNPHADALVETAYTTWSTDRANTVYNGHLNTSAALIGEVIDHASWQGIARETGTDYAALKEDILSRRQEALDSGLRMADFDKELVASIAVKAIEHSDPAILELLEETIPGYDVKLSSLPDFRDVKATATAQLYATYRRQQEDAAKRQAAEDKAAEDQIKTHVFQGLWEDPMAEVPEEIIRAWEKYDPEARKKLVDVRKTFTDGNTMEDAQDLLIIERMIQSGATKDDIFEMAANGTIKNPNTFRSLLDRIEQRQQVAATILTTQTTKRYLDTIKERLTDRLGAAMLMPDGLTDEGIQATSYFEQMLIEWRIKNPEATIFEQDQFIKQAADQVLERIPEVEPGGSPQFISPEDEERMATDEAARQQQLVDDLAAASAPRQPLATPQAPQGSAKLGPAADLGRYVGAAPEQLYEEFKASVYGQDIPPDFQAMEQAARQVVEGQAELLGVTPEEYVLETWRIVREGLGLSTEYTPPAPAPQSQANPDIFKLSNARSPEAAAEALSYFQSNPQAVRIDPTQIVDMTPTTSGNWNFGKLSQPNALVIHHTAGRGGVDGVVQTFKERGYPAHFVIDRDGKIHRILADDQKGQHTRPAQDGSGITNSNSWGVEIIAKDDSDLTPAQVQASIQLSYYLHDNYQMPLDRVVGHGQINNHKQETEGATVLAALSELAKGGNPNSSIAAPAGLSPQRGVEPLLAFISQEEGTRQDYNTTHSYGKYTDGDVDLVGMTLDQVLDLQSSMKARGSSGAVGKYQMLPGTLQDAMRALGMDGSTKFDAQTQEALAMWLLERRGLADWRSGKITTEAFVDNLAKEWASLSNSSGQAHYAGQGQNASLEGLLAALSQTT